MNIVLNVTPGAALVAKALRRWLVPVVRHLARDAGIEQFLDCGAGLATVENTHQTAQRYNRDATVIYLDNDPMVLVHGRALLEENDRTHFLDADLRRPADVLSTRPCAILSTSRGRLR
jgi:hypothetical protein